MPEDATGAPVRPVVGEASPQLVELHTEPLEPSYPVEPASAQMRTASEHVPEPEPAPEPVEQAEPAPPEPAPEPEPVSQSVNWDVLAECESHGEWDYGPHSGWGSGIFEGGLQFHPRTWDAYKPAGYPEAAYQASRAQQINVAELVLADQGLVAWPACTRALGWR